MHAPTPAAPVVDTTVCHQDADGRWVSDYSQSGLCTFGDRLDDVAPIAEDDPAFDCRAVGNLRCGIGAVLPDGSLAAPGDYSNPNCWPGAIYCPPVGTPVDVTTTGVEIS